MKHKIFVNNPWQENTILLYDETGEAAIIDCGCYSAVEKEQLAAFVQDNHLKPVLLLNTHLHIDHIFGNGFMKDTYQLEAKAGGDDNFFVDEAIKYAAMLGIRGVEQPPALGEFLKDGDTVKFGTSTLHVIATPGHSPGGLCFYSEPDRLLISGDSLFEGSVGRTDLPGGNTLQLLNAIKTKLFILPDDVTVIPGHGDATTIGTEKRTNPFFK